MEIYKSLLLFNIITENTFKQSENRRNFIFIYFLLTTHYQLIYYSPAKTNFKSPEARLLEILQDWSSCLYRILASYSLSKFGSCPETQFTFWILISFLSKFSFSLNLSETVIVFFPTSLETTKYGLSSGVFFVIIKPCLCPKV